MVLSVKTMIAMALCLSTFAASELGQSLALRASTRRKLAGIHHTTQYAPKGAYQPKDTPVQEDISESSDSCDSRDSFDLKSTDSADVKLKGSESLDISSSQDLDLDLDGSADVDVNLAENEVLDYVGEGKQILDLTSSNNLDFVADASLDVSDVVDTDVDFTDGIVAVDLHDDEDYSEELELKNNEELDETIDVPEGVKSIHLRMHNGNVDLDIVKDVTKHAKSDTKLEQGKMVLPKTDQKKKKNAIIPPVKVENVSFAAEAKNWISMKGSTPVLLGGLIGAAVGIVGVAVAAIAKRRNRESDSAGDINADADVDLDDISVESESDSDDDGDVETDLTACMDENAEEEKKTHVVEGSV